MQRFPVYFSVHIFHINDNNRMMEHDRLYHILLGRQMKPLTAHTK